MCVVALLVGNLMNKPAPRARHRSASIGIAASTPFRLSSFVIQSHIRRSETSEYRDRGGVTADHTFTHYCTTCVHAKIICNEYFGVRYLRPATTTVP